LSTFRTRPVAPWLRGSVAICSLLLALLPFAVGCGPAVRGEAMGKAAVPTPPPAFALRDVGAERGLQFRLGYGDPSRLNVLQISAGGAGFRDVDGDGSLDILLLGLSRAALSLNDGHGRFRDVTAGSGINPAGAWMGCAVGDYDNDGRPDLILTGYRCARLYH